MAAVPVEMPLVLEREAEQPARREEPEELLPVEQRKQEYNTVEAAVPQVTRAAAAAAAGMAAVAAVAQATIMAAAAAVPVMLPGLLQVESIQPVQEQRRLTRVIQIMWLVSVLVQRPGQQEEMA